MNILSTLISKDKYFQVELINVEDMIKVINDLKVDNNYFI